MVEAGIGVWIVAAYVLVILVGCMASIVVIFRTLIEWRFFKSSIPIVLVTIALLGWLYYAKSKQQEYIVSVQICEIVQVSHEDGSVAQSIMFEGESLDVGVYVEGYLPGVKYEVSKTVIWGTWLYFGTDYKFTLIE